MGMFSAEFVCVPTFWSASDTMIYGMFQDMGHAVFVLLICIVTCVWNMVCTMYYQLNRVYQ